MQTRLISQSLSIAPSNRPLRGVGSPVERAEGLPPRIAYDRWAPSYATSGRNPLTDATEQAVTRLLPGLAGRSVLDVACGDGRWARLAVGAGAASVVGLDFSAAMLRAARRADAGLAVVAGDMRRMPWPDARFDVALHVLALGHVADPAPALGEVARVLAPGGVLVVADMHPEAARRGWRRTFRDATGRLQAVRWYPHPLEAITRACARAGLSIERRVELALTPEALPPDAPAGALDIPALYALRARRAHRR